MASRRSLKEAKLTTVSWPEVSGVNAGRADVTVEMWDRKRRRKPIKNTNSGDGGPGTMASRDKLYAHNNKKVNQQIDYASDTFILFFLKATLSSIGVERSDIY